MQVPICLELDEELTSIFFFFLFSMFDDFALFSKSSDSLFPLQYYSY